MFNLHSNFMECYKHYYKHYNDMVKSLQKQSSPKDYGMAIQGKHRKLKKRNKEGKRRKK